jgi:DNA-binding Lrp family transcriptional regulator
VESKSLKNLLCQELRKEFGLSKIASEVLSMRSLVWLQDMNSYPLPGQLYLSVPSTPVKKYALSSRIQVKMTVVDVSTDGEVWREYGLFTMQKYRALRLIYEVWRQNGWVSYSELSSLLNLTITALSNRLRGLKEIGVWLPHVGNQAPGKNQDYLASVLVKEFLSGAKSETLRERFGLTLDMFELYLRNAVTIWELKSEGYEVGQISKFLGLRAEEVSSLLSLISDYQEKESWQSLYQCYKYKSYKSRTDADADGSVSVRGASGLVSCIEENKNKNKDTQNAEIGRGDGDGNENIEFSSILAILESEHGIPLAVGRVYLRRLRELADGLQREWEGGEGEWCELKLQGERCRNEGETIFLAISSEEGPRTRLSEGKILAVCLDYFTPSDLEIGGPRCKHKNRLCDLKSARIVRYARQARDQGALLSLPDIAMLMGISVDTVRKLIKAKVDAGVIVPTRGLMKDIGRGVSHKCKIIELYLQMYTESEIVDRSGHSYESIEAYVKEFARVVILAESGLNAVMIRQVSGRSMTLVNAYLDLYRKYDGNPDYVFRLEHIKKSFAIDIDKENLQQGQQGQQGPAENGKGKREDSKRESGELSIEGKKNIFSLIPTETGMEKS